ncbi:MAG TPA: methyltransferase [Vicinamibacteria bacterium]|nr:methyltransferase [Vicinamibacteria bacterium]
MNRQTVLTLNAINARFYRDRAEEFRRSRERPWRGWDELLGRWGPLPNRPSVLDVGCGNGRFATFLRQRIGRDFTYVGIDSSPLALSEARKRLGEDPVLLQHDFVASESSVPRALKGRGFDVVVLFGVLHHVPGAANRCRLLRQLAEHVEDRLVLTVWRFVEFERFRKKLVSWDDYLRQEGVDLDLGELEPGDHIMTWGAAPPGFRYCHALDGEEATALVDGLGLKLRDSFAPEGEPNRYFVLKRL